MSSRLAAGATPVVGIGIGVLTLLAAWYVHDLRAYLANAGVPWLVGAFLFGALMPSSRSAAVAGFDLLLGCVVGYYAAEAIVVADPSITSAHVFFWGSVALVGGPLFGAAGHWWRNPRSRWHIIAMGLLGAALIAEGAYFYHLRGISLTYGTAGRIEMAIGVLTPLLLGRTARERLYGLLVLPPFLMLGLAAFALIDVAHGAVV